MISHLTSLTYPFLIIISFLTLTHSIPILSNDDQTLNSIVISEIDFTTEHPLLIADTEISSLVAAEPEKSFHELIERYDEMFIKTPHGEQNLRKRNSEATEEKIEKSLIEKIEIEDPDVKKEFAMEISNAMQHKSDTDEDDTTEHSQIQEISYEPNYAAKIHENVTKLTIHEKENLQAHLVEQLVHNNENNLEFTTIVPQEMLMYHKLVKDPEIVEVLEHINYESENELKSHEHTTAMNIVEMDFDPIEIIPKDRHRLARTEVAESDTEDNNDKFAGFNGIPQNDLDDPGHEVTEPDHYFTNKNSNNEEEEVENPSVADIVKAEVDVLREALEIVAIYGKSLKIDDINEMTTQAQIAEEEVTTLSPAAAADVESATEVVDTPSKPEPTRTIIDVDSSEEKSSSSLIKSPKTDSSEEEEDDDSGEKENKGIKVKDKSDSDEEVKNQNSGSSEEKNDFAENSDSKNTNFLTDEIFKDSSKHDVKKKDHPDGLALPYVAMGRKFNNDEIFPGQDLIASYIDASTQATITAIYDAVDEVFTTVSDGIKLSNELRHNVSSFRDNNQETAIVLDTLREAISSKNSKNFLMISDEMSVAENQRDLGDNKDVKESMMALITVIAMVSMMVLVVIFSMLKRRSERIYFI